MFTFLSSSSIPKASGGERLHASEYRFAVVMFDVSCFTIRRIKIFVE